MNAVFLLSAESGKRLWLWLRDMGIICNYPGRQLENQKG